MNVIHLLFREACRSIIARRLALLLSIFVLAACGGDLSEGDNLDDPSPSEKFDLELDVFKTIAIDRRFQALSIALAKTDLNRVLEDESKSFTLFAPTDAAFEKLGDDTVDALLKDEALLSSILAYHVLEGAVDAETAISLAGQQVDAVTGEALAISLQGDALFINDSEVVITDIVASNGIIHAIDTVLTPPVQEPEPELANIVDTAVADGRFTTLAAALGAADLVDVLASPDSSFTVLAPTDDAFALLGEDTIAQLLEPTNRDVLRDILLYHVIPGEPLDSQTVLSLAGQMAKTANGDAIAISVSDGELFINDAKVIITDVLASNGIIHVLDMVLSPPASIAEIVAGDERFETLDVALQAVKLDGVLDNPDGSFTLFAPTNEAFAALGDEAIASLLEPANATTLLSILLYHALDGEVDAATAISLAGTSQVTLNQESIDIRLENDALFINDAMVIATDIQASNGVVHVLDAVLTPPSLVPAPEPEPVPLNLVETAQSDERFSTLVAAVTAAGLVDVLSDPEANLTVFAPTNDAFAALGDETLNTLLLPENLHTLQNILLYHVFPGVVDSATAISLAGTSQTMVNGDDIAISVRDDALFINDSQVIITDIVTSNGIIHAIDAVLLPEAEEPEPELLSITETAVNDGRFTTLVTALQSAGLADALADENAEFTVFAPTDDAFALLGDAAISDLLKPENKELLTSILFYHVIPGQRVDAQTAISLAGESVATASGKKVAVSVREGELFINDSKVIVADVEASNGVIHVIDMVLSPPKNILELAASTPALSTLTKAIVKAGLSEPLADETATLTVFAPSDEAFALFGEELTQQLLAGDVSFLQNILLYHVVANQRIDAASAVSLAPVTLTMANGETLDVSSVDGELFVNDIQVQVTDIKASNGIVHVIGGVLVPPDVH